MMFDKIEDTGAISNTGQNVQASVATKADSSNGADYIKIYCYKPNGIRQSFSGLSSPTGGQGASPGEG
jgi:hypothetical protein